MSPAIILAIGIGIATALVMALVAARQAGGSTMGPEERYGRELDGPQSMRGRRGLRPDARRRAMLIIVLVALAALGAGLATGLSQGIH
jgi:hypothetical protein